VSYLGRFWLTQPLWLGLKSLPLRHRQQRVAALTRTSPELVCRFRRGDVFPFQTRSLVARQATHSSKAGRPCASIFIGILADNSFPHACTWLTLPGACCRRADSQPLSQFLLLQVGGRVDYRQKVNDVNFVLSGTDATARDYEAVPAVKDAVITADTHFNGASCLHACLNLVRDQPWLALHHPPACRACNRSRFTSLIKYQTPVQISHGGHALRGGSCLLSVS